MLGRLCPLALGLPGGTAGPQLLERRHLSLAGAGRPGWPVLLGLGLGPGWLLARGAGEELAGGGQLRVRREHDQPVAAVSPGLGKCGPSHVPLPPLGQLVEGGDGLRARVSAELTWAGLGLCRPHWPERLLRSVRVEDLQPPPGTRGHRRGEAAGPGPRLRSAARDPGVPPFWHRRCWRSSIGLGEGVAVGV